MTEQTPEGLIRGWAKAYRDTPEHRFPSDPHAEFFPVDLEVAADEIARLMETLQKIERIGKWTGSDGIEYMSREGRLAQDALTGAWQDISTAPKDGTIIHLTSMEDGEPQEIWPMQWGHIQQNALFPGQVGMWIVPDGSITWNDDDMGGGPTHWRPLSALPPAQTLREGS